jgi:hypothetical protein
VPPWRIKAFDGEFRGPAEVHQIWLIGFGTPGIRTGRDGRAGPEPRPSAVSPTQVACAGMDYLLSVKLEPATSGIFLRPLGALRVAVVTPFLVFTTRVGWHWL